MAGYNVATGLVTQAPGLMSKLMTNKLFLQLLGAAGESMISGTPQPLGNAIQQNISSQNYMKLLSSMLGGNIPEGGKITHTDTGTQIHMPKEALKPADVTGNAAALSDIGSTGIAPSLVGTTARNTLPEPVTPGYLNPFVSSRPDISGSDLAGVSPEMISNVMQLKMHGEELAQKRLSDIFNILHGQGMLEVAQRNAASEEAKTQIAGQTEARQFLEWASKDDRPNLVREYEYARNLGYQGTLDEFRSPQDTTEWKNYLQNKANDPKFTKSFYQYQVDLRRAGSTTINMTPSERALDIAKVAPEVFFSTEDFPKWLDSQMNEKAMRTKLMQTEPGSPERERATIAEKNKLIESQIQTMGGQIVGQPRMEGRVRIWKVYFPKSGRTMDVRYGF